MANSPFQLRNFSSPATLEEKNYQGFHVREMKSGKEGAKGPWRQLTHVSVSRPCNEKRGKFLAATFRPKLATRKIERFVSLSWGKFWRSNLQRGIFGFKKIPAESL